MMDNNELHAQAETAVSLGLNNLAAALGTELEYSDGYYFVLPDGRSVSVAVLVEDADPVLDND